MSKARIIALLAALSLLPITNACKPRQGGFSQLLEGLGDFIDRIFGGISDANSDVFKRELKKLPDGRHHYAVNVEFKESDRSVSARLEGLIEIKDGQVVKEQSRRDDFIVAADGGRQVGGGSTMRVETTFPTRLDQTGHPQIDVSTSPHSPSSPDAPVPKDPPSSSEPPSVEAGSNSEAAVAMSLGGGRQGDGSSREPTVHSPIKSKQDRTYKNQEELEKDIEKAKADLAAKRGSLRGQAGGAAQDLSKAMRDSTAGMNGALANVRGALPPGFNSGERPAQEAKNPNNQPFDPRSPDGKVRDARNYLNYAKAQIKNPSTTQKVLLDVAGGAIDTAADSYKEGDVDAGDFALEIGKSAVDIALGFVPGVGWAKDLQEAVTGYNLVTQQKLSGFERGMAVLGVVTAGVGSKLGSVVKGAEVVGKVLGKAGHAAPEAIEAAEKIAKVFGEQAAHLNPNKIPLDRLSSKTLYGVLDANVDAYAAVLKKDLKGKIAIFYSGPGNRLLAEAEVEAVAKAGVQVSKAATTLEKTVAGAWLDELNNSIKAAIQEGVITNEQYRSLWNKMSTNYAAAAEGSGRVFQKGHTSGSTFIKYELPEIRKGIAEGRIVDIKCMDCGGLPAPWE